jgi:hypothetical protein
MDKTTTTNHNSPLRDKRYPDRELGQGQFRGLIYQPSLGFFHESGREDKQLRIAFPDAVLLRKERNWRDRNSHLASSSCSSEGLFLVHQHEEKKERLTSAATSPALSGSPSSSLSFIIIFTTTSLIETSLLSQRLLLLIPPSLVLLWLVPSLNGSFLVVMKKMDLVLSIRLGGYWLGCFLGEKVSCVTSASRVRSRDPH